MRPSNRVNQVSSSSRSRYANAGAMRQYSNDDGQNDLNMLVEAYLVPQRARVVPPSDSMLPYQCKTTTTTLNMTPAVNDATLLFVRRNAQDPAKRTELWVMLNGETSFHFLRYVPPTYDITNAYDRGFAMFGGMGISQVTRSTSSAVIGGTVSALRVLTDLDPATLTPDSLSSFAPTGDAAFNVSLLRALYTRDPVRFGPEVSLNTDAVFTTDTSVTKRRVIPIPYLGAGGAIVFNSAPGDGFVPRNAMGRLRLRVYGWALQATPVPQDDTTYVQFFVHYRNTNPATWAEQMLTDAPTIAGSNPQNGVSGVVMTSWNAETWFDLPGQVTHIQVGLHATNNVDTAAPGFASQPLHFEAEWLDAGDPHDIAPMNMMMVQSLSPAQQVTIQMDDVWAVMPNQAQSREVSAPVMVASHRDMEKLYAMAYHPDSQLPGISIGWTVSEALAYEPALVSRFDEEKYLNFDWRALGRTALNLGRAGGRMVTQAAPALATLTGQPELMPIALGVAAAGRSFFNQDQGSGAPDGDREYFEGVGGPRYNNADVAGDGVSPTDDEAEFRAYMEMCDDETQPGEVVYLHCPCGCALASLPRADVEQLSDTSQPRRESSPGSAQPARYLNADAGEEEDYSDILTEEFFSAPAEPATPDSRGLFDIAEIHGYLDHVKSRSMSVLAALISRFPRLQNFTPASIATAVPYDMSVVSGTNSSKLSYFLGKGGVNARRTFAGIAPAIALGVWGAHYWTIDTSNKAAVLCFLTVSWRPISGASYRLVTSNDAGSVHGDINLQEMPAATSFYEPLLALWGSVYVTTSLQSKSDGGSHWLALAAAITGGPVSYAYAGTFSDGDAGVLQTVMAAPKLKASVSSGRPLVLCVSVGSQAAATTALKSNKQPYARLGELSSNIPLPVAVFAPIDTPRSQIGDLLWALPEGGAPESEETALVKADVAEFNRRMAKEVVQRSEPVPDALVEEIVSVLAAYRALPSSLRIGDKDALATKLANVARAPGNPTLLKTVQNQISQLRLYVDAKTGRGGKATQPKNAQGQSLNERLRRAQADAALVASSLDI